MDDILAKLGWQKVAAILAGVAVLGIIYVIFSFQGMDAPKKQGVVLVTPTIGAGESGVSNTGGATGDTGNSTNPQRSNPGPASNPTTNNNPATNGNPSTGKNPLVNNPSGQNTNSPPTKADSNSYYTLTYPKSYLQSTYSPSGGILNSSVLRDQLSNASVEITTFDAATNSLEALTAKFAALHFAKSDVIVGPYQGVEFAGTVVGKTTLHEKIILLKKNNVVIQLIFDYYQNGENSAAEEAFKSMVLSIK